MRTMHICTWLLLFCALSTTLAAAAAVQPDSRHSQGVGTTGNGIQTAHTGYGDYVSTAAAAVGLGHKSSHRQRTHLQRHEPHERHEHRAHISQHRHRQHSSNGAPNGSGSMYEPTAADLGREVSHSQEPARLDEGNSAGFDSEPLQQQLEQQEQQRQQQQLGQKLKQPEPEQRLLEQQVHQLAQQVEQQQRQLEQQWRQLEHQQQQLEQQQRQLQLQEQQQQQLAQSQQKLDQRGQQQPIESLDEQSHAESSSGTSADVKAPHGGSTHLTAPGDALQKELPTGPSQRSQSRQDSFQQQQQQHKQQQQQDEQLPQLEGQKKPSEAADVAKPTPNLPDSKRQTTESPGSENQEDQAPDDSDQAPAKKRAPDFDDPSTWPDPVDDATREEYADAEPGLDSTNGTQPVKKPPGGYWPYYGQFVPDPDADIPDFPGGAAPGTERRFGEPAPADYGDERKFGDPAPGDYTKVRKLPRALNVTGGDCKADSSPIDAQGSGVIIDDSATVADGVVTATADCVEAPGTTFQKGGHCELVCTDEADYKVVQKTLEKLVRTGVDGQVRCEAQRVTDSISIKGICSLIPVAECCEAQNPEEEYFFEQEAEKRGYADSASDITKP